VGYCEQATGDLQRDHVAKARPALADSPQHVRDEPHLDVQAKQLADR
jgi:hypothetical protein